MSTPEIFAELGIGNESFFSTEIENGNEEYRMRGFKIPGKIRGIYFRLWMLKKVIILSTLNGLEVVTKKKKKFKAIFGIRGYGKR